MRAVPTEEEEIDLGRRKSGYNLVSAKAPASRSSAVTAGRMCLEREYDLGQGGSLRLRAMAREGLSRDLSWQHPQNLGEWQPQS